MQILKMKSMIDQGISVDFYKQDPFSVAGLIKLYLREMSECLLTFEMFDILSSLNFTTFKAKKIRACLDILPLCHYKMLVRLLKFLKTVSLKSGVNLMTDVNLATVFGPNLLRPKFELNCDLLNNATLGNNVTMCLIENSFLLDSKAEYSIAKVLYEYSSSETTELNLSENLYKS